jgi:hypothetical protein
MCAFYGLDTEPEPEPGTVTCQKSEPELVKSRNLNISKVGTGTVKNSYCSATLVHSVNIEQFVHYAQSTQGARLSIQSSESSPPTYPFNRKRVLLPLSLGPKGETLSLAGKGLGRPNSDDGTATPVLYVHYKYNPFSINRHEYICMYASGCISPPTSIIILVPVDYPPGVDKLSPFSHPSFPPPTRHPPLLCLHPQSIE